MKKTTKTIITSAVLAVCAVLFIIGIIVANQSAEQEYSKNYSIDYELAKVLSIENNYEVDPDREGNPRGSQTIEVEVLTGEHKGDVRTILNPLGPSNRKVVRDGSVLTVKIETSFGKAGYQISITNYNLIPLLIVMIVIFVAAVLIVGRKKGMMSLIGLTASLAVIIFFLIPMWLKGNSATALTMICCIYITVLCFTLLGGISRKTVSAMLGTVLCLFVAYIFAEICSNIAGVSGYSDLMSADSLLVESRLLEGITLNIRGLFVAGILISALGAVMDVAMSIASAVDELRTVNPGMTSRELFKSGMNVGRDMIGTMTNTLILAFAGTSLATMIIMYTANMKPLQLINNDDLVMEAIRGIAGSLGLITAVPLTAAVASASFGSLGMNPAIPATQGKGSKTETAPNTERPRKQLRREMTRIAEEERIKSSGRKNRKE